MEVSMKPGEKSCRRRVIRVGCALCGGYLYSLVTDLVRVVGVCLTCVYREGKGK